MTILLFLLVLSFLVIIHELGHFFTARLFSIKIEEFGIGIPPKVKTLFTWKGIPFTLNALPIGGFVRMEGEDGEASLDTKKSKESTYYPFYTRKAWQRLIVILAGASVNFIYGVLVFIVLFAIVGIPTKLPHPLISFVGDNTPAQASGIQLGDEILSIRRSGGEKTTISTSEEFISSVKQFSGETIAVTIKRKEKEQDIQVYVRKKEEIPEGEGAMGVALSQTEFVHYPWYIMPLKASVVGISQSLEFSKAILQSLSTMVSDLVMKGRVPSDVSGPVGIAYQVGKEDLINQGFLAILNFSALLSINLAIMNVLPIPALDGGRAVFILLERIIPKKYRSIIEQRVNSIGFICLISLIVLITIKDVLMIFSQSK